MRKIFLTGATGVMGTATMRALLSDEFADEGYEVTVLARDSKTNRRKLSEWQERGVNVIWGDLLNPDDIERGVSVADVVLHVGGMVSPAADWHPEQTLRVNVEGMRNVVEAAKRKEARGEDVRVVYIGSVSQYGNRAQPFHWGRVGDPIRIASFDNYALSKNLAEVLLAESGLKEWVSLRQTGIMHPGLLMKASDPITFHVPMLTVLEWVTDEESGRLLAGVSRKNTPDGFWRNFYNIGGGESYRKSNYDFVCMTLRAVGCPAPEKVFDYNWFATRNFHGMWYEDSDDLEALIPFRSGNTFAAYINNLKSRLPFYFKLTPLAPAFLIKAVMKQVAKTKVLGPLCWLAEDNEPRIYAAWGGREKWNNLPKWEDVDTREPSNMRLTLMHGYDEAKKIEELTLDELREAAEFRGGKLLSSDYNEGDIFLPLEWECADGHKFSLSLWTVLRGGHWCPNCLRDQCSDPHAAERQSVSSPYHSQAFS